MPSLFIRLLRFDGTLLKILMSALYSDSLHKSDLVRDGLYLRHRPCFTGSKRFQITLALNESSAFRNRKFIN